MAQQKLSIWLLPPNCVDHLPRHWCLSPRLVDRNLSASLSSDRELLLAKRGTWPSVTEEQLWKRSLVLQIHFLGVKSSMSVSKAVVKLITSEFQILQLLTNARVQCNGFLFTQERKKAGLQLLASYLRCYDASRDIADVLQRVDRTAAKPAK